MSFSVQLTDDAARDLEEISDYISRYGAPGRADYVLDRIEAAFRSLSAHPLRGNYPNLELGIREFREVFFKPYRIFYRVIEKNVYVLLIVDAARHAVIVAAALAAGVGAGGWVGWHVRRCRRVRFGRWCWMRRAWRSCGKRWRCWSEV